MKWHIHVHTYVHLYCMGLVCVNMYTYTYTFFHLFQISAQDIADQLIGVDSVSTFGFSLAGQVDVDANEYNG